MSTSLAAQLQQIAAKSTNSLNLKAQRTAHAQSLIFEPKLAATQDFDTIFQICQEGFQELCLLDPRFVGFGRNIFSEQSKTQDRTQMTAEENEVLDRALGGFMDLVGGRLLLKPAVKAMDWLVRRFRYIIAQTSLIPKRAPNANSRLFSGSMNIMSCLYCLHFYLTMELRSFLTFSPFYPRTSP